MTFEVEIQFSKIIYLITSILIMSVLIYMYDFTGYHTDAYFKMFFFHPYTYDPPLSQRNHLR